VTEPSEEALAIARELYARFEHADNGNDERALAAAFQRLMDHIDKVEALADKQNGALKEALERWEQAKRRYDAAGAVVIGFKERAEKAEAELAAEVEAHRVTRENWELEKRAHERNWLQKKGWIERAEKANARLAELVLEVRGLEQRGWWSRHDLQTILAKYDGGEHG
jgi:predicted  nucleic acid-binding Zn-ribbon protein